MDEIAIPNRPFFKSGFDPGIDIYVGIGIPIESEFQFIRET